MDDELVERELCYSIIGAFFEVYNYFGYGLSESTYAAALECELRARGHTVAREVAVSVTYKGQHVGWQRFDMIVDGRVIVENKTKEKLPTSTVQQILSYLHVSPIQVGLILHFGPKAEYKRFVDTNKKDFVFSIRGNPQNPPNSRSNPVPSHLGTTDPEPG